MSQAPEMKIKALAPWFGGKRTLAPRIVAELGKHDWYGEGCCGGLPIVLAKPAIGHEYVCDLHGDMINLARVVQSDELAPRLFERLGRTLLCEPLLADADQATRGGDYSGTEPDLVRAYNYFVVCWGGRNGEAGLAKNERGRTVAMRWSPNGGGPGVRFRAAVDSLPAWWERLRGVTILRRDWFDFCPSIKDRAGTAVYIDPPYLDKSDQYLYDFENNGGGGLHGDDHDRLAAEMSRFRSTRVVVSYYAHQRLKELYPPGRWTHVDCSMAKNTSNQSGKAAIAPEVLIVNGPSFTEGWKS